jgi:hypothetical protein
MFALKWLSAHRGGRELTEVLQDLVERAADEACTRAKISSWQTLFSPLDPAVNLLVLFALPNYRATTPERPLFHFVSHHAVFFYDDAEQTKPSRTRIAVLWPKVQEFRKLWERDRVDDAWCAAKAMAAELKKHHEPVPKGGGRW